MASATVLLRGGDEVHVGTLSLDVLETPGHTQGHLAFHLKPGVTGAASALFTGLFVALKTS